MKTLRKQLLIAATVAGLGLGTFAFAGPMGGQGPMMGDGPEDCPMRGRGPMGGGEGRGQRMAMMQQHRAEQMELLETRLKLKPEQQTAWKEFISAQNAHHAARMQMRAERRNQDASVIAHFEGQTQAMEQNLAAMKTLTKAATDLYAALDPTQKKAMDDFFATRPMRGIMHGPTPTPEQPAQ